MHVLKQAFNDLAARNPTNEQAIDKRTFLRVFTLPGMLGERLFAVFDRKKREMLDFNDLIAGLALIVRGSSEEKNKFLFDMYDFNSTGTIEKIELTTMLNSAVFAAYSMLDPAAFLATNVTRNKSNSASGASRVLQPHGSGFEDENPLLSEELKNKVDGMVKTAFQDLAPGKNSLNYEEFKKWVLKYPENLEVIEAVFRKNNAAVEDFESDQINFENVQPNGPNSDKETNEVKDEQKGSSSADRSLNSSFRSKSQFRPDLSNPPGRTNRAFSVTRKLDMRRSSSADTRKKFLDDVLSAPALSDSPRINAPKIDPLNRSFGKKRSIVRFRKFFGIYLIFFNLETSHLL
jgi:Ca2+-binding EF-hand superfamily protein